MEARHADWLTEMMRQVIERGTGRRAQIPGYDLAGKTGTTQGARDAWFIGFSSDYVVGVGMGKDDNTPLVGVTGGGLPAEIWRETMRELHRGRAPAPIEQPGWLSASGDDAFRRTNELIIDSGGEVLQSLFQDLADLLSEGARERGVDVVLVELLDAGHVLRLLVGCLCLSKDRCVNSRGPCHQTYKKGQESPACHLCLPPCVDRAALTSRPRTASARAIRA